MDTNTITPAQAAALLVLRRLPNRHGQSAATEQGSSRVHRLFVEHPDFLLRPVEQAARHALLALEIALAGRPVWAVLTRSLAGKTKLFRQQMEALLDLLSLAGLPCENPASRRRCFEELRSARQAGLAAIESLDVRELESGEHSRNGNVVAQAPDVAEQHALVDIREALGQAGFTLLAGLIGLRSPWGQPLYLELVDYFLNRTLRAHPRFAGTLPDSVAHESSAQWRCLELVARLLEKRAEAVEALLDKANENPPAGSAHDHDDEAVERLFKQGLDRHLHGDYLQAAAHFTAALKLDPSDARLYAHRGEAYRLQGENERAIADFEAALRLNPSSPSVLVSRAAAYHSSGEHARAVADSGAALQDSPHNAAAYRIRGAAHAALGSRELALADLTAAIGIAPADEEAHFQRGLLHLGKRDYAQAVADFNRVLKLNRHRLSAYLHRGQAHRCRNDYTAAVRDFSKVLRHDPRSVPALAGRGSAYRLQGDLDRALADYDQALLLEPNNSQVWCSRGVLYRIKGDLERAWSELDEAVRLDSMNWSALYHRGKVCLLLGRLTEARTDLTAALAINERILHAYLSRAIAQDRLGQYQEALADSTQAIALDEHSSLARLVRGIVHNHAGEYAKAVADLTEAIDRNQRLAPAYHERSIAYTRLEDYEHALADCNRFLVFEASNAPGYAHRSIVYQLMGDVQKALVDYNQAMQLDPQCLLTALDPGLADSARQQTARQLADLIDGLRHDLSTTEDPPPPPFRIVLQDWPKGSIGISRITGGEPVPLVEPASGRRKSAKGTNASAKAASTQAAPPPAEPVPANPGCQSVPSTPIVFLNPMDRPVYSSTKRRPRVDKDYGEEEEPRFLEKWRKPALLVAGVAALAVIYFGFWFKPDNHVRVYPAHGQAFLEGKPIADASIRLDPVWTSNPVFPRPHATVREDGSFALGTYGKEDGAPVGEYKVSVQLLVKSDKAESEGGKLPQSALPPKYGKFETSGLTVQIQEGENAIPALHLKR